MTTTLKSVQRIPDTGETLVAFDINGAPSRNVLLRTDGEFAVPAATVSTLNAALAKADSDIEAANQVFATERERIDGVRRSAIAAFNSTAESLARQQMAKEDAPPPVVDEAPAADTPAAP